MTSDRHPTIRNATVDDAAAVHALIAKLATSVPSHIALRSSAADFERAMAGKRPALRALIAEYDGNPVGVLAFFTTFSTWYGTPGVYVQDIFVAEQARGTGLGRRLLAAACQWGLQHGADHLRLSVDRANSSAQAFYESHELTHCVDEKIYMIEGDAFAQLGARE